MSETAAPAPAAASATPVKASEKKAASKSTVKKPKSKPPNPPTGEMVNAAIAGLKERGGSSLQAIKKYIAANFKVDSEKLSPFIRKYLKSAVASGSLAQPKGNGASDSFKIAVKREGKAAGVKKPKPAKPTKAKKPATSKPKAANSKKTTASIPKSPKAKKVSKPPTKKPKSPKPKKAAVNKQKLPKKTSKKK